MFFWCECGFLEIKWKEKKPSFFRNFANVLSTTLNILHHIPHTITATFTYSLILAIFASHLRGVTVVAIYVRLFLFDPFTGMFFLRLNCIQNAFFRFLWTNNISFKFYFKTSDYKIFDYFFCFFCKFYASNQWTQERRTRTQHTLHKQAIHFSLCDVGMCAYTAVFNYWDRACDEAFFGSENFYAQKIFFSEVFLWT